VGGGWEGGQTPRKGASVGRGTRWKRMLLSSSRRALRVDDYASVARVWKKTSLLASRQITGGRSRSEITTAAGYYIIMRPRLARVKETSLSR